MLLCGQRSHGELIAPLRATQTCMKLTPPAVLAQQRSRQHAGSFALGGPNFAAALRRNGAVSRAAEHRAGIGVVYCRCSAGKRRLNALTGMAQRSCRPAARALTHGTDTERML
jgi:hypothetical protein